MKHKALLKGMLAAFLVTAAVSGTAGKMPVLAAEDTQGEIQAYQAEEAQETFDSLVNHNGGLSNVHFLPENEKTVQASVQSEDWKTQLTQKMTAAFESGETVIDVSELMLDTNNSELNTCISQFLNENPQYFYVRYVYKNEKMRDDNGYYTKIKSMKVWYNADYMDSDGKLDMQRIREKKAEVENGIKNALTAVSSDMSDIEKALALHDWVVRECDYDFENYENNTIPAESYSYVGVFANGQAVCQGYAEAMSVLFQKVGIESYVVTSSSMNHAWNIALLDGEYYHIDATWDDPYFSGNEYEDNINEGYVRHVYFVRSDKEMTTEYNHNGWTADNLPVCTSENSYKNYIFREDNPRAIQKAFSYADGRWYYFGWYDGIGGEILSSTADGKNLKTVYTEKYLSGLFVNDGTIYAYNRNYVFSVSVDTVKNAKDGETVALSTVYDLTQEHPDYSIQEFCIKKGVLIMNTAKAENGYQFEHIRIDLYENKASKRVAVSPAKKTYEVGEALDTAGAIVYDDYGNGIIRMKNSKKITVTGYNANTVGKQTLQILYDGQNVGSYNVNVQVGLTGISLSAVNAFVKEGDTMQLTVTYNPSNTTVDKTVTWTSSNPSVATVNADGVITGIKYGTATITAKVGTYTAECRISVTEAEHNYVGRVVKEATCTEYGQIRYTCSNCGTYYTTTISPLGHEFGEWYTKSTATCNRAGVKARMCNRCTVEETQEIPQKPHIPVALADREATCIQAGYVGGTACQECGAILEQPKVIEALGHIGGMADCSHLAVCSRCGQPYGGYAENVHNHTTMINVKEAAYEQNGYTGDKICQDCGTVLSYGQTIPALKKEDNTPDTTSGWREVDGVTYWYENGVRQGYDPENPAYRGKEIYDPSSKAWYWLDNAQQGAVAKDKDVYQESYAGQYADRADGTGKWVRYDENGYMIKGEDYRYGGWYRFDETTGAMVKGWYTTDSGAVYYYNAGNGQMEHGFVTIDNTQYLFDETTGVLVDGKWYMTDGNEYWYEGGIRQGTEGRGKEIYDDVSKAWYWLDAVDGGKKAVSKDVYQESYAGQFADRADGTGKWVRYDENGHMIKGFDVRNGNEVYYFDEQTGAMAKGTVVIKGVEYYFNPVTGICERSTIL